MSYWVPWQLAPDSDPEERWILVDANDENIEHPNRVKYGTEEESLIAAEMMCRRCGSPNDDGEGYDGMCGNCADLADEDPYL